MEWQECGTKKYNISHFFSQAKDWYPAGLESCRTRSAKERKQSTLSIKPEDNVSAHFGKSVDLEQVKKLIKIFAGEDVSVDSNHYEITLTVENRRRLELCLPEKIRLPHGPLGLHTNENPISK